MLYTAAMKNRTSEMGNSPTLPDEVDPRKTEFSFRAQWKVNHWAYAAILFSLAGDVLARCNPDFANWPAGVRLSIALGPILPALLWLRSFRCWLRGMDELDRRITLQVCLFSVSATFYLDLALQPLRRWGVVQSEWGLPDWHSLWFQSVVLSCLYLIGARIFNRRYR
jgi:hypothetical protein